MNDNNYDLPLQLQVTASALSDFDNQILHNSLSIGIAQYKVLITLEGKALLTQKHIALRLDQTEASISRQVAVMYEDGLIKTQVKKGDRRVHYVILTPRGKRYLKRAQKILAEHHAQTFASFSKKKQEQLRNTLLEIQNCL